MYLLTFYYVLFICSTYFAHPPRQLIHNIDIIGVLSIESIDLILPVADNIQEETLRIAVGRVPQTAQIGEVGNAVIVGHRNFTFGQMFNRLDEVNINDIIIFTDIYGKHKYFRVFETAVINIGDQITFIQPINNSIITLYTCTPIREQTHRLIVRAKMIYMIYEISEERSDDYV